MNDEPLPPGKAAFSPIAEARGFAGGSGGALPLGTPRVLLDANISLREGSPFYGLLVTFVAASAGMTPVFDGRNYPTFLEATAGVFPGHVWPQMTTNLGDRIKEVRGGAITQADAEEALQCMLANAAWERMGIGHHDPLWKREEVQFLRHVRNAASHRNRWHFRDARGRRPATPDLPASWRGMVIPLDPLGTAHPWEQEKCLGGNLGPADLLRLLLDIEEILHESGWSGPAEHED